MMAWAKYAEADISKLRFSLPDGNIVEAAKTPDDYGWVPDEIVNVLAEPETA